jgi:hypothetical protein
MIDIRTIRSLKMKLANAGVIASVSESNGKIVVSCDSKNFEITRSPQYAGSWVIGGETGNIDHVVDVIKANTRSGSCPGGHKA